MSAPRYKTSTCPECRTTYLPIRFDQRFCSSRCNLRTSNREATRGRQVYALAYRWRTLRGKNPKESNAALTAMCRIISRWGEVDAKEGRGVPGVTQGQAVGVIATQTL